MEPDLVSNLLQHPERARSLELSQWDLLIRQARPARLLARLYHCFQENGVSSSIPEPARWHFEAAWVVTERHADSVRWEIREIHRVLYDLGVPVILLKGAAYLAAGLPPAAGRVFSDVDIMVPKGALKEVEEALKRQGWLTTHHDEYDQRYYRQWMQELPPLKHLGRQTLLDVHHTLLPETARHRPDAAKLFAGAVALEEKEDLYLLSPADMVLHSASHLFCDGEFDHGLRDLADLDALLRRFGRDEPFWEVLVERGVEMDLSRPLFYALRYTRSILGTPVPEALFAKAVAGRPGSLMLRFMDSLFRRALKPDHASCGDPFTGPARWMLYVRGHYLRMPFRLLIPHLFHKAFITPYSERKAQKEAEMRLNPAEFAKGLDRRDRR